MSGELAWLSVESELIRYIANYVHYLVSNTALLTLKVCPGRHKTRLKSPWGFRLNHSSLKASSDFN